MKRLIACGGLDCESCDARRATVSNDRALREKTARAWSAMNHAPEITADTIACMVCRTDGTKFAFCRDCCEIRKCVRRKGFDTCGECEELDGYPAVGSIFRHAPEAEANLLASKAR